MLLTMAIATKNTMTPPASILRSMAIRELLLCEQLLGRVIWFAKREKASAKLSERHKRDQNKKHTRNKTTARRSTTRHTRAYTTNDLSTTRSAAALSTTARLARARALTKQQYKSGVCFPQFASLSPTTTLASSATNQAYTEHYNDNCALTTRPQKNKQVKHFCCVNQHFVKFFILTEVKAPNDRSTRREIATQSMWAKLRAIRMCATYLWPWRWRRFISDAYAIKVNYYQGAPYRRCLSATHLETASRSDAAYARCAPASTILFKLSLLLLLLHKQKLYDTLNGLWSSSIWAL